MQAPRHRRALVVAGVAMGALLDDARITLRRLPVEREEAWVPLGVGKEWDYLVPLAE